MPSIFLYPVIGTYTTDSGSPTITGSDPWDVGDDMTYTVQQEDSKAPFDAGFTYRADTVRVTLDTLDSSITPTAFVVHVRSQMDGTSGPVEPRTHAIPRLQNTSFGNQVPLYNDDVDTWHLSGSATSVAIDLADDIPNSDLTFPFTLQNHYDRSGVSMSTLETLAKAGTLQARFGLPNFTTGTSGIYFDQFHVYEFYVEVQYAGEDPTVIPKPVRRVFPRDDRNRVYPPPRSMQHGRRTGGSTYF